MTPIDDATDRIARRLARGKLQKLAERIIANSDKTPSKHCSEHADLAEGVGYLLLAVDELLTCRRPVRYLSLAAIVGGVTAGVVVGLGKLLGF